MSEFWAIGVWVEAADFLGPPPSFLTHRLASSMLVPESISEVPHRLFPFHHQLHMT